MIDIEQVVIAVVGVVSASLIALAVYRYRGVVTFDILSLSRSFKAKDGEIVVAREWNSQFICLERITVANRGWTDIDNFKIHISGVSQLAAVDVISTKTLSKEVVIPQIVGSVFEIATEVLPRGEEIVVEIAYLPVLASSEYLRSAKGVSGKYVVKKKADYEALQRFLREFLPILIISAVILLFGK